MRNISLWPLLALIFFAGCASRAETRERLDALEGDVSLLKLQEVRLSLMEDRLNELSTRVLALGAPEYPLSPSRAAAPRKIEPDRSAKTAGAAPAVPAQSALAPAARSRPAPVEPAGQAPARPAVASPAKSAGGEQQEYAQALAVYEAGSFEKAITLFNAFLESRPQSSLAPNAGYWLGECEYALKRYDRAILAFKGVVSAYPRHPKAAASMLKSGYAYERLGDKENARFYLTALVEDFPASEPAALARKKLSSL
jgi:tol-pal system protein YbgF